MSATSGHLGPKATSSLGALREFEPVTLDSAMNTEPKTLDILRTVPSHRDDRGGTGPTAMRMASGSIGTTRVSIARRMTATLCRGSATTTQPL